MYVFPADPQLVMVVQYPTVILQLLVLLLQRKLLMIVVKSTYPSADHQQMS